jgi:signal transduction histidine kinase/HPt (histidine-containing phosphotransfer) domain-containing protein
MIAFNNAKILIVDDNISHLGPLIDLLSQHGAIPLIAQNGADALELIQENRPDLILMDIILPYGMNGFQTCQNIKSDPQFKEIPIIFLSSLKSIIDKINAFEAGGVDYIEKPLENNEVLIRVNTHLKIKYLQDLLVQKNEDLEHAKKQAERANQSKSIFLANMSHEIRTPMNSIVIANDLLSATQLTADQAEYVEIMKTSSSHLKNIINDILDLSQIESGKIYIHHENFDLYQLLNEIEQMFSHVIRNKGLTFTFHREDNVPQFVKGDANRIRQILINLIGNALKFTQKGEIKVIILQMPSDNHCTQFEVHDTGIGIPKNKCVEIFKDFTQACNTIRKQFGGTGLGLSICQKLVNLMGGELVVESEESKGSIFSFTIPFKSGQKITEIKENTLEQMPCLKILLVDDVPINRKSAGLLFKKMGHEVMAAENGIDAIKALQSNTFDIIFMDLEMPEMDGLKATQLIRQGEAGNNAQNTPVIAMTAHAMTEIKKKCLETGMNDFISKPVDKKSLVDLFNKLNFLQDHSNMTTSKENQLEKNIKDLEIKNLIDAFDGDKEGAFDVIEQAYVDFDVYIDQLRSAYESNNFEALRTVAHTLKGMTANIYANTSNRMAKQLEDAAKQKDDARVNKTYNLFLEQIQQLKSEIYDLIKNPH